MKSGTSTADQIPASQAPLAASRWRDVVERAIHILLFGFASISILTTVGIVVVLLFESVQFFFHVSVFEFLTGTKWTPLLKPQHFGILPLLSGTMLVACGSAVIAIPLGLGSAIYLSEYAAPWFRDTVKPLVEVLAGIPSVVYGYFAIVFISPLIRSIFPSADVFNAANACIVVGIMTLPIIISLSEDVLRGVPGSLREGAYALGAHEVRRDRASRGSRRKFRHCGVVPACHLACYR